MQRIVRGRESLMETELITLMTVNSPKNLGNNLWDVVWEVVLWGCLGWTTLPSDPLCTLGLPSTVTVSLPFEGDDGK